MRPASAEPAGQCPHCATPVAGPEDVYCCRGCEAAATLIRASGLDRYYSIREEAAPRPVGTTEGWSGIEVEAGPDGVCEAKLTIEGLRCASCVWVNEAVLRRLPGVLDATVSYATGRATVRWRHEETDLPTVARAIQTLGYRPRVAGELRRSDPGLLARLGVAGFAAGNVMLMSAALYAGWVDPMDPSFTALFRWWTLVLATPVALWCASPFFGGAWSGLRHGVLHMDVPIALAVAVLYGHGLLGVFIGFDTYLDSLTMLVALLLCGRVLESAGRRRGAEAALALAATVPATARRRTTDGVEWVPSDALEPGDLVDVGAGEELPADGSVAWGRGTVQRSLLTGESDPVPVSIGDEVWAGTVLLDGSIAVRVKVRTDASVVRGMADALAEASGVSPGADGTDRLAPWFTLLTLLAASLTWLGWTISGSEQALSAAIAVLVVACPCALALARPVVGVAGLGAAARRGVLFRSPLALLEAARVDLVVLDKTGTVTEGALRVVEAADEDLRVAAGLERFSGHPRAEAIVREAVDRAIPIPVGGDVTEIAGQGILGVVDGLEWEIRGAGADSVEVVGPDRTGTIRFGDRLRDDAASTIDALRRQGFSVRMISGDGEGPTRRVASEVGEVASWSSHRPEAKVRRIEQWRADGRTVLFAGDGLNDGPALAAAHLGVAMGAGAASTVLAADAVVVADRLGPLEAALRVARVSQRLVSASRRTSLLYNVAAVGAAAAGWVNPLVAAILMPLSSALVLVHARAVEPLVARTER